MEVVVLGLAGGSAVGKSTLARALLARTPGVLLEERDYLRDASDPLAFNFDEPAAVDHALMATQLRALRRGQAIEAPIYRRHRRQARTRRVEPAPLVVVEGLFVLHAPALRGLLDRRVYLELEEDARWRRRLARDGPRRGEDAERARWRRDVQPGQARWVTPSRAWADRVLRGDLPVEAMLEALGPL